MGSILEMVRQMDSLVRTEDWRALDEKTEALVNQLDATKIPELCDEAVSDLTRTNPLVRANVLSEASIRHGRIPVTLTVKLFGNLTTEIGWDARSVLGELETRHPEHEMLVDALVNVGLNVVAWTENDLLDASKFLGQASVQDCVSALMMIYCWLMRPKRTLSKQLHACIVTLPSGNGSTVAWWRDMILSTHDRRISEQ